MCLFNSPKIEPPKDNSTALPAPVETAEQLEDPFKIRRKDSARKGRSKLRIPRNTATNANSLGSGLRIP